jgi:alpha-amylase
MSAPQVTLLMAVHCHQPVGNFDFVFEDAYAKAYEPFLSVLERHPKVRLALHYSGSLLDWLRTHRPGFLRRVRALAARGQVELLASGYYEPILPMIPEADRQGQIAKMRRALRNEFGAKASGLWLTERVWEPQLPETLSRAGIRYTMVDTNQFAAAKPWLPASLQLQDEFFWDLLGCYTTDCAGSSVALFPASKRLRYWLPFQPVERTMEFLRRIDRRGGAAITFADDGEKFGFWPTTFRWVYEEGWLDQFFAALERERGWLATSTFQDYLEQAGPAGRAYLPSGSYEEMLEWSGGHFRNFFAKYPEAQAMRQKMLHVSRAISDFKARGGRGARGGGRGKLLAAAEQELYAGQCNCAYWHGVFGGLYLSHLRRAVYAKLLRAERLIDRSAGGPEPVVFDDLDGDGLAEVALKAPAAGVVVDPAEGGAITEWSLYDARINLLDTLTRRPEPYHDKLKAKRTGVAARSPGGVPSSIHDVLGVKEERLEAHLSYDDHRRSAFLDHALESLPALEELRRSTWGERRLWSGAASRWAVQPPATVRRTARRRPAPREVTLLRETDGGRSRKTVRLSADGAGLECRYELEGALPPVVALEFNLSLRDERYLTAAGTVPRCSAFTIEEPGAGVRLTLRLDPPATLMHFPIETVSESEEGLERTYQGLCLMCCWAGERTSRLHWLAERL